MDLSKRQRLASKPLVSVLTLVTALGMAACAGGPGPGGGAGADADEGAWESLLRPRPEPLESAVRVTVSEILIVQSDQWGMGGDDGATAGLTVAELVSAELLRRRDVHFVERRRFGEAAERARRGLARPPGAPPVGISPGAELFLTGAWAPVGSGASAADLRLTRVETGDVVASWRVETPARADPTSLARAITGSLMAKLDEMGRRPSWEDPLAATTPTAPARYEPTGIPVGAAVAFARGVAAEDQYRWEAARRAYQAGLEAGGEEFFEARVALARVARLRAGGSLGASE